jgi:hypothetical protein
MKKRVFVFLAAGIMSASVSMTVFAGAWKSNSTGWWYDNGDGTYPAAQWQWIDGNGDGTAESYYFDQNGYCLLNTSTPDGYTVDVNGAWTENGVVQQKNMAVSDSQEAAASDDPNSIGTVTVIASEGVPIYPEAGSDVEACGKAPQGTSWPVYRTFVSDGWNYYQITDQQYVQDYQGRSLSYTAK